MDHDHIFSASRSDPGLELVRLLSVSPPLDEGPYTATVPLESSPFVIYNREHILDREPELPTTPVKMRFGPEVDEADGDDSPVTNPYALVGDAEASESSSPLQETHDEPNDPFIDVVDNNGQYRGSIPYMGHGWAPYGNNTADSSYGFGVSSSYHSSVFPQAANANTHFNVGVNGVPHPMNGVPYAVNATSMNMNTGYNVGYDMGTNNMQTEPYLMIPVSVADANAYFAHSNVNRVDHANGNIANGNSANGNHTDGNHANGINNANGMVHGHVGGPTNPGLYPGTFGYHNHNRLHIGADGSVRGNAFSSVGVPNLMGAAGPADGTMFHYHHYHHHQVNGTAHVVDNSMGVNRSFSGALSNSIGMSGWTPQAAVNNQIRGHQDPVTLRAHMTPNPLESARNELEAVNQRLYRVTQELERAVQTFRQHLNESSNEVQRMNQMTSRLGDATQVPVVRRGLELLSSDIRHRINQGRAVTFVDTEEDIVLTRGRQHNNRRQQGQGHQGSHN